MFRNFSGKVLTYRKLLPIGMVIFVLTTIGMYDSVQAHTSGHSEGTAQILAHNETDKSQDTVLLKEPTRKRRMLDINRQTNGLREHKSTYGKLAIISLVVVAIIGYFIFRKPKPKS